MVALASNSRLAQRKPSGLGMDHFKEPFPGPEMPGIQCQSRFWLDQEQEFRM
jgi:hypothetical protein